MRHVRAVTFVLVGFATLLVGFVYDARFAGLPYQDPTPQMQAGWLYHKDIASMIMLAGLAVLLAGAVWGVVSFMARITGWLLK